MPGECSADAAAVAVTHGNSGLIIATVHPGSGISNVARDDTGAADVQARGSAAERVLQTMAIGIARRDCQRNSIAFSTALIVDGSQHGWTVQVDNRPRERSA